MTDSTKVNVVTALSNYAMEVAVLLNSETDDERRAVLRAHLDEVLDDELEVGKMIRESLARSPLTPMLGKGW